MTSNEQRAATLARALRAGIDGDHDTLRELLTGDVHAWTPAFATVSLSELIDQLERREAAFTDIALDVAPLDVGGDYACVEWTVEMTHTGTLTLGDGTNVEPTNSRVTMHGITVAEFEGERICSLRQYRDEFAVLDQLGAGSD
jgi:hypothetical protein